MSEIIADKDFLGEAEELARYFETDAPERDRKGGTPKARRDALRESGLLNALIPRKWGGLGLPWSSVMAISRVLSTADSSLGHLFGSGSPDSDVLTLIWADPDDENEKRYFANVPSGREGITIHDNWDHIGQRTGSGTVSFHNAIIHTEETSPLIFNPEIPFTTIGPILSQSVPEEETGGPVVQVR